MRGKPSASNTRRTLCQLFPRPTVIAIRRTDVSPSSASRMIRHRSSLSNGLCRRRWNGSPARINLRRTVVGDTPADEATDRKDCPEDTARPMISTSVFCCVASMQTKRILALSWRALFRKLFLHEPPAAISAFVVQLRRRVPHESATGHDDQLP